MTFLGRNNLEKPATRTATTMRKPSNHGGLCLSPRLKPRSGDGLRREEILVEIALLSGTLRRINPDSAASRGHRELNPIDHQLATNRSWLIEDATEAA